MENKMTDNEIIKALECCSEHVRNCAECPLNVTSLDHCSTRLAQNVLDLINRQKAKIERLKKYDEERDIRLHARLTEQARAEAIKEFAERLKAEKFPHTDFGELVYVEDIDNLVKEMVGRAE